MIYKTAQDMMTRARRDTSTVDEPSVTDTMLVDWINDAIDFAESKILGINEDYFLTKTVLNLVTDQIDYDLATLLPNLYAGKIRGIIYKNGTTIYPVKRVRSKNSSDIFESIAITEALGLSDSYRYVLRNDISTEGFKLQLIPQARESGAYLHVWYIRNANRVTISNFTTVKIDIPEADGYINAYLKERISDSEGHPLHDQWKKRREELEMELISALEGKTPDDDNEIIPDTSIYEEHA